MVQITRDQTEADKQLHVVSLFTFVGLFITSILGTFALFKENYPLATALLLFSSLYLVSIYLNKKLDKVHLSANIILYSLYLLMFYLVYSGGESNTGPLWIFMVAPVSLFIHGLHRGSIDLLAFTTMIILIMFMPLDYPAYTAYSTEFKLRLIYSFVTVSGLSALYEYSREKSLKETLELSQKYQELANFDSLTHLSNRRNATIVLTQEYARAIRNAEPLSIIMCDVDNFKQINDAFGHHGGDQALIALATLFKDSMREQDNISRWGGEEFMFILPQTSAQNAHIIAEKIRHDVEKMQVQSANSFFQLTVSMGIAECEESRSIDETISLADKQLYLAKNTGKNRINSAFSIPN